MKLVFLEPIWENKLNGETALAVKRRYGPDCRSCSMVGKKFSSTIGSVMGMEFYSRQISNWKIRVYGSAVSLK